MCAPLRKFIFMPIVRMKISHCISTHSMAYTSNHFHILNHIKNSFDITIIYFFSVTLKMLKVKVVKIIWNRWTFRLHLAGSVSSWKQRFGTIPIYILGYFFMKHASYFMNSSILLVVIDVIWHSVDIMSHFESSVYRRFSQFFN